MTQSDHRGGAPTLADTEYEQLWVWWVEEYGLRPNDARWLAFYQYAGGNAFGLKDLNGNFNYAPRAEA